MADYALKIAYSRRDDPVRWNIECAKQEAARVRYAAHEVEAQGIDAEGRSRLTLMPSSLGGREASGRAFSNAPSRLISREGGCRGVIGVNPGRSSSWQPKTHGNTPLFLV